MSSVAARVASAVASFAAGRKDEAEVALDAILRTTPTHPVALHLMALCRAERHDQTAALELIEQALEVYPGYSDAVEDLGFIALEGGALALAERWFRRAIILAPFRAPPHYGLGVCLLQQGHSEEAAGLLRMAAALDPDDPRPRAALRKED